MLDRSIVNVLGFTIALLAVSGCSATLPREITVSATPIDKPELVLPTIDRVQTRNTEWVIITPENFEEQIQKLTAKGNPIVFFALTNEGYEALALNLSDLRTLIQQQQAIIAAYEGYYKNSNNALDAANAEIVSAVQQTTQSATRQESGLQRFNPFN